MNFHNDDEAMMHFIYGALSFIMGWLIVVTLINAFAGSFLGIDNLFIALNNEPLPAENSIVGIFAGVIGGLFGVLLYAQFAEWLNKTGR
jgi:hypothetical protein